MQFTQLEFKTKSVLTHDFIGTVDTDLHKVLPEVVLDPLKIRDSVIKNIQQSGLLEAASIPISVHCVEFVISCIKHYNSATREIRSIDGRVICSLKPLDIERSLDIPQHSDGMVISMSQSEQAFNAGLDKCQNKMIERWLKQKKSKLPNNLGRGECKDEYNILITLLNRVSGHADANKFHPWMYYIIGRIISGQEHYDWASFISDVIHEQITGFLAAHQFHMCSYLVYLIAYQNQFNGLNTVGILSVQKVYRYYDQLEFTKAESHFKRVQEAFLTYTVRNLDRELHIRISTVARAAMKNWADWYIQFPTYTYIRVYGYTGKPAMLPRYPSDKTIFMEFLRQLYEVHKRLRIKRKPAAEFPLQFGMYWCRTAVDAKTAGQELENCKLKYLVDTRTYDPWGHYAARLGNLSYHKPTMEDYWVNCEDDFEVRRRSYSRFSLPQVSVFLAEDVEGLTEDEGDTLPQFYREQVDGQPLPLVNWYAKEFASVKERSSRVIQNSMLYLESRRLRKASMPRAEPPPEGLVLPSSSKPKQKKRSNPPKKNPAPSNSKGKASVAIPHVEPVREVIQTSPQLEVQPRMPSPTPLEQPPIPIHIDLDVDSPPRSDSFIHSHSSDPPTTSTGLSSGISRDSSWLESQLGRKRRQPSYILDHSDFDHDHQDVPEKRIKKQIHIGRSADKEFIVETAVPPEDKSLDEMEAQDFEVITVHFGKSTRQTDIDLLQVATDSVKDRMVKDGEDKSALKAEIQQLRQYISSLVHRTGDVVTALPHMLEPPAEQGQIDLLVAYGKRLEEWEEEFVARGRLVLTELYQLRYNARELRLRLQDEERDLAISRPRDEILIANLGMSFDSVTEAEDKEEVYIWRTQLIFKAEIEGKIVSEVAESREHVTSALRYIRDFVSQLPCVYQRVGGDYVELADIQLELQALIHGIFSGETVGCKMNQLTAMSTLFDEAIRRKGEFQCQMTNGEDMLHRHRILRQSFSSPDGDAVNDLVDGLISQDQGQ